MMYHRNHKVNEKLFWSRAEWEDDCLIWKGKLWKDGYGNYSNKRAHRLAYTLTTAEIPAGLYVLHSCDVRACINPAHLRVGTQKENIQEASDKGRHTNGAKTHCPKGHEYTSENTRVYKGRRWCKECDRIKNRRRYAEKTG